MTKRVAQEEGALPRSRPLLRTLLTCAMTTLALGAGATSAQALDGVSGEFADTEGIFRASCQALRSATGLAGGDLVLACDANSEQCHLVSASGTIDEGQARGFCADSVLDAPQPHRRGALDQPAPALESNVVLNATTFGTNIGYSAVGSTDIGNIFCETFETPPSTKKIKTPPSPGKKVCVNVFKGSCTSGICGIGDGSIVVRNDSCTTVRQVLATPFGSHDLAYWVFVDLDKTGQKGSEVLSVCPGFAWNFLPTSDPVATELTAKYQGSKSILYTPGCFKDSVGQWCCYCTAPKKKCWSSTLAKYFCDDDSVCDGL
jgi:hypothetical protein